MSLALYGGWSCYPRHQIVNTGCFLLQDPSLDVFYSKLKERLISVEDWKRWPQILWAPLIRRWGPFLHPLTLGCLCWCFGQQNVAEVLLPRLGLNGGAPAASQHQAPRAWIRPSWTSPLSQPVLNEATWASLAHINVRNNKSLLSQKKKKILRAIKKQTILHVLLRSVDK